MKLSEQCCTLQQSERLEELGVTAKSAFYHVYPTNKWLIIPDGYFNENDEGIEFIQAYTVAELLQALPGIVVVDEIRYSLRIVKNNSMYSVCYFDTECEDRSNFYDRVHEKQAPLLADCLIHLLENNLLTPAEVNEAINK